MLSFSGFAGLAGYLLGGGGGYVFSLQVRDSGFPDCDTVARLLAAIMARRPQPEGDSGLKRLPWGLTIMLGCTTEVADDMLAALIFRRQLVLVADQSGRKLWCIAGPPAKC